MNITINIITWISNNFNKVKCIHSSFASPFSFLLESLPYSTINNCSLYHFQPSFQTLWDQPWLFLLITIPIPISLASSSSPHRSRCKVIPLPGILTYTKCMLVYASNRTSHIFFVSDNFIIWQFTQQVSILNTHTFSNSHFTLVI